MGDAWAPYPSVLLSPTLLLLAVIVSSIAGRSSCTGFSVGATPYPLRGTHHVLHSDAPPRPRAYISERFTPSSSAHCLAASGHLVPPRMFRSGTRSALLLRLPAR